MNKLIFALLLAFPFLAFAEAYSGNVVGISDGDTITVLDNEKTQHKVRLAGIDAPEKAQAFGNVSKQHLANLVFRKQVTIEFVKFDRYHREIGKVIVDGLDANLEQVKAGLAWHYKQYARDQPVSDRKIYSDAEANASAQQLGLWRDANPTPPWDFRKSKRGGWAVFQ